MQVVVLKNIAWLWASSLCDVLTRRVRFVVRALTVYCCVKPMIAAQRDTPLGRLIEDRPETVGAVIWPYQCAGWNARTRLARICEHYSVIERMGGPIDFPVNGKLLLVDLCQIREGLHVTIDRSKWFMREGDLVINLFLEGIRMYSLAFSFFYQDGGFAAFIGAIQGRDNDSALQDYRDLTRASNGMRPRDLLIELFRIFCATLGVESIFAVADDYRSHRHRYFGKRSKPFFNNYDEIWKDRGGIRVEPMFFRLGVDNLMKSLDTVPPKKRGMYRRRYAMLESVRRQMHDNYARFANNGDCFSGSKT